MFSKVRRGGVGLGAFRRNGVELGSVALNSLRWSRMGWGWVFSDGTGLGYCLVC